MFFRKPVRAKVFCRSTLLTVGVLLAGFSLALNYASPAAAQSICAMRSEISKKLSSAYTETPTAIGLANNGSILEVFTSPSGDSWTIVITSPDGVSCLMATGENWDVPPRAKLGKES